MEQLLISVNEKLEELKKEIKFLRSPKECPFYSMFGDKVKCIYKDNYHECYSIEVAPGNGDAWCTKQINKSLTKSLIS